MVYDHAKGPCPPVRRGGNSPGANGFGVISWGTAKLRIRSSACCTMLAITWEALEAPTIGFNPRRSVT